MAYNLFSENGFNLGSADKHYSSLGQNVSPFTPVPPVIDREERPPLVSNMATVTTFRAKI